GVAPPWSWNTSPAPSRRGGASSSSRKGSGTSKRSTVASGFPRRRSAAYLRAPAGNGPKREVESMFSCAYSGRVSCPEMSPEPAHPGAAGGGGEVAFLRAGKDGWGRGPDPPPEAPTADPDTQDRLRRAIAGLKCHEKNQAGPEPPVPTGTTAW